MPFSASSMNRKLSRLLTSARVVPKRRRGPVAKAFERYGKGLTLELGDRPSTATVVSDYPNALHLVAEDRLQGIDHPFLTVGQRDNIPRGHDFIVAQRAGPIDRQSIAAGRSYSADVLTPY